MVPAWALSVILKACAFGTEPHVARRSAKSQAEAVVSKRTQNLN